MVGRVGKPHGVRGEVSVDVRTDEPDLRFAGGQTLRARPPRGEARTLTVGSTRWHQDRLLAAFDEVTDRSVAEALRGSWLYADLPADAAPEDPDEFYDHQLVGLRAHDEHGTDLGAVTRVVHGAQDLLTIRTHDGRDALVPFVRALVPEVDLAAGRVVVADRPGLVAPEETVEDPR